MSIAPATRIWTGHMDGTSTLEQAASDLVSSMK
jgi:hypothetical protein